MDSQLSQQPQNWPGAPSGDWWQGGQQPPPLPRQRRPRPTAIPGLASWSERASAAVLELAIAGGLMSAYGYLLVALRPAFAVVQLGGMLLGVDIQGWLAGLFWVIGGGYLLWQAAVRGQTGQSLGGRIVGIVLVDEDTGAPIGPARSVLRTVAHLLDALPGWAGFLRPVTHPRAQTWADTVSRTVVVRMSLINSIATQTK